MCARSFAGFSCDYRPVQCRVSKVNLQYYRIQLICMWNRDESVRDAAVLVLLDRHRSVSKHGKKLGDPANRTTPSSQKTKNHVLPEETSASTLETKNNSTTRKQSPQRSYSRSWRKDSNLGLSPTHSGFRAWVPNPKPVSFVEARVLEG